MKRSAHPGAPVSDTPPPDPPSPGAQVPAAPVWHPCPACGTPFAWPATGPCQRCGAGLASDQANVVWHLDRQLADLSAQRAVAIEELRATSAVAPLPPPPPGQRLDQPVGAMPGGVPSAAPGAAGVAAPAPAMTAMSAQTLLGLAGAALLVVAAIVFAAVTWDLIPPPLRVGMLLVWTLGGVGAAVALARRSRPVTAGALGLLAAGLAAVTVAAAHVLDVLWMGSVPRVGALCLAAVAACLIGVALTSEVRWARGVSRVAWVVAVSFGVGWGFDTVASMTEVAEWHLLPPLAVLAAAACMSARWFLGGPGPLLAVPAGLWLFVGSAVGPFAVYDAEVGVAVVVSVAVVVAAVGWGWPGHRPGVAEIGTFLAVSTFTGLVVAWVARVGDGPWVPGLTALAVVALIGVVEPRWQTHTDGPREMIPALLGSWPATGWVGVLALQRAAEAATALAERLASPWARTVDPATPVAEAVIVLVLAAVVIAVAVLIVRRVLGDAVMAGAMALVVVAGPVAWHADLPDIVTWLAAAVTGVAAVVLGGGVVHVGLEAWQRRALLVAGVLAVPIATGWLAHDAVGTLLGSAAALAVVAALRVGGVGFHDDPASESASGSWLESWPGDDVVGSSVDLLVGLVGVVAAAVVGASLAGVVDAPPLAVAVLAAVSVAIAAEAWLRVPAWVAMTVVGVADLAIVMIALGMGHTLAASAAGLVAALGLLGAATVDRQRPFTVAIGWATGHGVLAALLLRADPDIGIPEVWTTGPAIALLALGAVRLAQDADSRSIVLIPGLAVGLVPTLVAVLGDPGDAWRAVALAVVGAVLLVAGSVAKVSTPVLAGALAVAVVVLTQSLVLVRVLPRIGVFALFAVLGVLLVIASATYERRTQDLRRLRGHIMSLR